MSKSNTFESDLLLLIFNNTAMTKVGDAAGLQPSAAPGSLYVSLHTADPGEAGAQTTSEIAYGGYARAAVARTAGGWLISATAPTQAANVVAINFPACTSGSGTATFVGIGTDSAGGAGKLLYSGAITTPAAGLAVSTGITPSFAISACVFTED